MIFINRDDLRTMIAHEVSKALSLPGPFYRVCKYQPTYQVLTGGLGMPYTIIEKETDFVYNPYRLSYPVAQSEAMSLEILLNTIIRSAGIELSIEPAKPAVVTATCKPKDVP